jgi:hypothetical protein
MLPRGKFSALLLAEKLIYSGNFDQIVLRLQINVTAIAVKGHEPCAENLLFFGLLLLDVWDKLAEEKSSNLHNPPRICPFFISEN